MNLEISERERELLMVSIGVLYGETGARELDELHKRVYELKE